MLESLGYTVTTSKNGEEAIDCYRRCFEQKLPYDAVILDLTVKGGMGGKQAVKEILSINPNACCIVSSGYSSDPIMAGYSKYGFKGVLCKPYPFDELASLITTLTQNKSTPIQ